MHQKMTSAQTLANHSILSAMNYIPKCLGSQVSLFSIMYSTDSSDDSYETLNPKKGCIL